MALEKTCQTVLVELPGHMKEHFGQAVAPSSLARARARVCVCVCVCAWVYVCVRARVRALPSRCE